MELEDALHRYIAAQAPVVSLIGEPNRLRFFKSKVEQNTRYPSLVQQRGGAPRTYGQCGVDGAVAVSIQIDSYGTTWATMAQLARRVREALNPYPTQYPMYWGTGNSPDDSVKVKSVELETEFDRDDPEPGLICRTQLWTIWIYEP